MFKFKPADKSNSKKPVKLGLSVIDKVKHRSSKTEYIVLIVYFKLLMMFFNNQKGVFLGLGLIYYRVIGIFYNRYCLYTTVLYHTYITHSVIVSLTL